MKKILLVTLDFWPNVGGIANYYFNLCRNLDARSVVVLTTKGLGHRDQGLGFRIYRKNLLWKFFWPKWLLMFWHIGKVVKKEQVELLWAGEILPTGTVAYCLSKILKLPYIVSCHGMDILQAKKVGRKKKLAQKILKNAKYVVVNSKYTGGLVKSLGIEHDKIKVIYPGIGVGLPAGEAGDQGLGVRDIVKKYNLRNKKILLSVGRLVKRKGFDKVIQALPKVWQEIPELVYVIAGDGPERKALEQRSKETMKQCQGKLLEQRVLFLGCISEQEKWALLNICDIFITVAQETKDDVEGFGIVYLEAASYAKPVIAGNLGGVKEAVINQQTGLLVNSENIQEITQAIIKLFKDKELAKKLGEQGKERVIKKFKWGKITEEFRKILV